MMLYQQAYSQVSGPPQNDQAKISRCQMMQVIAKKGQESNAIVGQQLLRTRRAKLRCEKMLRIPVQL